MVALYRAARVVYLVALESLDAVVAVLAAAHGAGLQLFVANATVLTWCFAGICSLLLVASPVLFGLTFNC